MCEQWLATHFEPNSVSKEILFEQQYSSVNWLKAGRWNALRIGQTFVLGEQDIFDKAIRLWEAKAFVLIACD